MLLANLPQGFTIDSTGYKAEHGSLTYRDALVPVAVAFPGTKDENDETFAPFVQLLDSQSSPIKSPIEADVIRRILLRR